MKISFHGAAHCVTGSKHLVEIKSGKKILLDCGLFQGGGADTDSLNRNWGFEPAEVDALILSHAHIDHSGLIPKLVKDGFKGNIYCTPATLDLAEVLLYDSAHIQESDIKFINKKRIVNQLIPLKPLYTTNDVKNAMVNFKPVDYNIMFKLFDDVSFQFIDAGHIVGSATVHVDVIENGKIRKLTFSGDLGRYNTAILNSPKNFRQADIIICESTYGDKLHDDRSLTSQQLLNAITNTCLHKKGRLIIPAFSVGRTQEILYALNQLENENKLPLLDYYVDSPLSTDATLILKKHKECFNDKVLKLMKEDKDPFDFKGLEFVLDKTNSQLLNNRKDPLVIISASGMADAGRVKHHIAHAISDPANTILMVGFCEENTLGAKLMRGDKRVRIFGEEYEVKADVEIIRSFSAHGDYEDISQWLACQDIKAVEKFFVVHGEYKTQQHFQTRLLKKGFAEVIVPTLHQTCLV
ncbi:MAG: hypothetical protein RL708_2411 [Bacteroidota bacterium]|jgi:metallo-beta-lactamase family protein